VDEAIFKKATAIILGRVRAFELARDANIIAENAFLDMKNSYRDWPERR